MKKKNNDPRHKKRQQIIKLLFADEFYPIAKRETLKTAQNILKPIIKRQKQIDQIIGQAALKWPIERINKIDLAILRLAVWELCFSQKEPPKVIIDEAVELAKEFGAENSPKFVNGVLGTVFKNYDEAKK